MTAILIPRIYTNRDPGAPAQDASVRISFLQTLEAVLVTGYGTFPDNKEPLGWTSHWNLSGTIVVFMPSDVGSNGIGLYLDSTQGGNSVRQIHAQGIIGFDGWDGDVLVGAPVLFGSGWVYRNLATAGNIPWWIIGTSRCVYVWTGYYIADPGPPADPERYWNGGYVATGGTTSYEWRGTASLFFGDAVGAPTDPYNTAIFLSEQTSTSVAYISYSTYLGYGALTNGKRIAATPDGLTTNVAVQHRGVAAYHSGSANGAEIGGQLNPPIGSAYGLMMDKPYLYQAACTVRGYMPGIFFPLANFLRSTDPIINYMHEFQVDGRSFILLSNGASGAATSATTYLKGAIAFELNVPWYPS